MARRAVALASAFALGCAVTAADAPQLESQARADFEAGRVAEALAAMQRVVELAPDDAEVHFTLGVMALRTDRIDEAESELARAVALAPRNARFPAAHGLALRAQRRWRDAEGAFLRALLLEPGDASTIAALGELYRLAGDPEKCALRYEQFVWQLERRDAETLGEGERRALASARERVRECDAATRSDPKR